MDKNMQLLLAQVAELGELSEAEARRIVNEVYKDGIVSRDEAESLFSIHSLLRHSDESWSARFAEAICDFLLNQEQPLGSINGEEAKWLISQVERTQTPTTLHDVDLLISLLRKAKRAPTFLGHYTLRSVCGLICETGRANADLTGRVRFALYASGSDGSIWVSRMEANILFETNDAIAFAKNHPSWNDLFARAIANHLMARAHPDPKTEAEMLSRNAWLSSTSPNPGQFVARMGQSFFSGNWFENVTYSSKRAAAARLAADAAALREAEQITDVESSWLKERLGWDEKTSPAERALMNFLNSEFPGLATGLAVAA